MGCLKNLTGVKVPPPNIVVHSDAYYPDIPPHLVKCLDKKPRPGETADEKVTNRIATEKAKAACSKAILKWYEELQASKEKGAVP